MVIIRCGAEEAERYSHRDCAIMGFFILLSVLISVE